MHKFSKFIGCFIALATLAACASSPTAQAPQPDPDWRVPATMSVNEAKALVDAADMLYRQATLSPSNLIEPRFLANTFTPLQPVRIYWYNDALAIALYDENHCEQGLYILCGRPWLSPKKPPEGTCELVSFTTGKDDLANPEISGTIYRYKFLHFKESEPAGPFAPNTTIDWTTHPEPTIHWSNSH
jgi:hypothetical protein